MRIVFLTHRLPYAPNRGDRMRALYELRTMASRHEVHLASLVHDRDEESHAADLRAIASSVTTALVPRARNLIRGIGTLAGRRPLTHTLLDSAALGPAIQLAVKKAWPDVVVAFCSSMVRFALAPPLAETPLIFDMVDVDSAKWSALAERSRAPRKWVYRREARCLSQFERVAARRARVTYVVNSREAGALKALAGPEVRVEVLENGVDLEYLRSRDAARESADVVFCGVMDYAPNEAAAVWMAREVWPAVKAAKPDARLLLVGANPTSRVRALSSAGASVVVTGSVPDVRQYLWNAGVAVAPLAVARGVQNKVLEAVAAGLPAVVTPVVAQGLPSEILPACLIAESAGDFAHAVVQLLSLPVVQRRNIVGMANLQEMAWEKRLQPLLDELERIGEARAHRI